MEKRRTGLRRLSTHTTTDVTSGASYRHANGKKKDSDMGMSTSSPSPSPLSQTMIVLAVRGSPLASALTPILHHADTTTSIGRRGGIPEYIGGDSLLRSTESTRLDTTIECATFTNHAAVTPLSSNSKQNNADDPHHDDEEGHRPQKPLQQAVDDHSNPTTTTGGTTTNCSCDESRFRSCSDLKKQQQAQHRHGAFLPSPSNIRNNHCGWVWKIHEASLLPSVPQEAPLERASLRIITEEVSLDTITARISNFLRLNSISTSYPTEAPGRVDCRTSTCIKFVIQLWRANTSTDDRQNNGVIVVEVQRRRGCCIRMRYLRNCLYKCILSGLGPCRNNCGEINLRRPSKVLEQQICRELYGASSASASASASPSRNNNNNNVDGDNDNYDDEEDRCNRRRHSDGQLVCVDLLASEKVDEKRLGIECFLSMTDPQKKEDEACSHEVARALVYNEGILASRLRPAFLGFLCARLPLGEDHYGGEDGGDHWSRDISFRSNSSSCTDDDTTSVFEAPPPQDTEVGDAHALALAALVNCLQLVDAHQRDYLTNDASKKLKLCTSPFWSQVLQVLIYNLQDCVHLPLEAALSAKCLRILENLEPERLSPLFVGGGGGGGGSGASIAPLLKTAHEFGKAHHWSLEKESEELVLRFCSNDGDDQNDSGHTKPQDLQSALPPSSSSGSSSCASC